MKKRLIAPLMLAAFVAVFSAESRAQQTLQSRPVRPAAVTGELLDIAKANDGRVDTRAASGRADYVGMSFVVDLGGEQNVIGVAQDHGRWPTHFPGAYKVEVGTTAQGPWMLAWQGEGQRGESKAKFEAIRGRFIRVTATGLNTQYKQEWSVAELTAGVDPGQKARAIPTPDTPKPKPDPSPNPGPIPPGKVPDDDDRLTPRAIRNITAQGFTNINAVVDDNNTTRAATNTASYAGAWVRVDLGSIATVSRVVQVHEPEAREFPGRYRVEVSADGERWQTVFEGAGERGRSVASFAPVRARFVRVTATASLNNRAAWTLYKLKVRG
ncbi:MAG TPA: discoidin domain-containing protein [Blastocatellia bacterium]|nr:discoidin domain-containing protein [Blastocatellia bacterium]